MVEGNSFGLKIFKLANYVFLISLSLLCILPLINILAISFSSNTAVASGEVTFWPVGWTTASYQLILDNPQFLNAIGVTIQRVVLGVSINLLLTILIAYPLSKEVNVFRMRTFYAWFFVFTMLFGGGLIPWYMVVKNTGLLDTIWALVLPGAVPVFNVVLLLNFFRGIPKELEEAAFMDGAGHWTILWRIYVPLALPALATIFLFSIVGHWNSWFDGIIFMNSPENYPLQSYLQTIIIQRDLSQITSDEIDALLNVSDRTSKAAQIFVGALPILLVYPFLQKYFMKGIVMGSVKE
ncbi:MULTISPECIES: carbohydrate ABC transporter permease [Metabacillus]|uniref:carbohydrate ABC transporter permease n=1 Tax=Metabacillus TaxID=2675233 RepID=UPI00193A6223|nr:MULTISPECIES: carbohydrate ABC transporter permease [Metabacillus]